MPEPLAPKSGIDDQHADDGPAGIEERSFLHVRPEICHGSRNLVLKFGNNDFSDGAERGGSGQAGQHRRPVPIVAAKLAEGSDCDPIEVFRVRVLIVPDFRKFRHRLMEQ
jgi:hypothetical protein